MPNGENPAMNAVQALGLDAAEATSFVNAGAFELSERDHAVLVPGNPGSERVRIVVGDFPTHVGR